MMTDIIINLRLPGMEAFLFAMIAISKTPETRHFDM